MGKISFYGSLLLAFLFSLPQMVAAQSPAMDSQMVKDGKIYVVVAVLVVILIGIIFFLYRMERRLNKLEKQKN